MRFDEKQFQERHKKKHQQYKNNDVKKGSTE